MGRKELHHGTHSPITLFCKLRQLLQSSGHGHGIISVTVQKTETEIVGCILLLLRKASAGISFGQCAQLRSTQCTDRTANSSQRIACSRSEIGLAHCTYRIVIAHMAHFMPDNSQQLLIVQPIHQSRKDSNTAVSRSKGVDGIRFIHFEIKRNTIDSDKTIGQSGQSNRIGIIFCRHTRSGITVTDVLCSHPLHLIVAQIGRRKRIYRCLQSGMWQTYFSTEHHQQINNKRYQQDFNHEANGFPKIFNQK